MPTMMRQGIEELVQYETKTNQKRVYTYEKAVERWDSCPGLSVIFLWFCADIFHYYLQVVGSKPESVRSVRAHPFRARPSSSWRWYVCALSHCRIVWLAASLLLSAECFSSSAGFVFSRDLRVNFVSHFSPSQIPHLPLSFKQLVFSAPKASTSTCHFRKTLCASVWSRAWRCSQEFKHLFWLFCKKHHIVHSVLQQADVSKIPSV